jgi:hypothetical protein
MGIQPLIAAMRAQLNSTQGSLSATRSWRFETSGKAFLHNQGPKRTPNLGATGPLVKWTSNRDL